LPRHRSSQQRNIFNRRGHGFAVQQSGGLPWFQVAAVIARELVYKIVPEGYGAEFLHNHLISHFCFAGMRF
jgi:hypothetical protein